MFKSPGDQTLQAKISGNITRPIEKKMKFGFDEFILISLGKDRGERLLLD